MTAILLGLASPFLAGFAVVPFNWLRDRNLRRLAEFARVEALPALLAGGERWHCLDPCTARHCATHMPRTTPRQRVRYTVRSVAA
jgi:hypothetical protein